MERFGLPEEVARVGLRALKAITLADGKFDEHERRLMTAAARALRLDVDVDALEPASPDETADAIVDPVHRERLVQAQLICALIDGAVSAAETDVIGSFAKTLGVDEPRLANLAHLTEGHLRWMQFDLMRSSSMVKDVVRKAWQTDGLGGVWKTIAPFQGIGRDPALAQRYLDLGALPEGTFGRAYFLHMTERGFSFPGEQRGFPPGFVKHDLCHVLGGYDTDPAGECDVIAFIAGFMKSDPFGYLFMIAVHCHLGIEIFQGDATGEWAFDPDRVLTALSRGMNVRRDLYDVDFDWWPYMTHPLEQVRAELGVV